MAIARWKDLCIDATDAHRVARFWGGVLGLEVEQHDDGDAVVRGANPEATIWVNAVPEPRATKQRVHLDIETPSLDPILALGATVTRAASVSGLSWDALADPEGGELCAFVRGDGPTRLYEMVVDTADAASSARMARWWADVMGGQVVDDERGFSWLEEVPGLPFESIDFDLDGLLERGATVLAPPTDATPWHVLADPDGNEFCVFHPDP
jgi:hypothetical protein